MTLALLPTTISSAPIGGLLNYDVLTQVIYYSDVAAVGNFQINFRGDAVTTFASAVPVGNTINTVLYVQNGATPYALLAITVDGLAPTTIGWLSTLPSVGQINQISQIPISITHSAPNVFLVY
jgi:hypothetical protein